MGNTQRQAITLCTQSVPLKEAGETPYWWLFIVTGSVETIVTSD